MTIDEIDVDRYGFVHLHNHTSEGSLLDGAAKINDMVKRAKELGMSSLAITDHGTMYGVIDFYKACWKEGIKPIVGCEIYVAPRNQSDRVPHKDDANYHLVLLAETNEGYKNLVALVSSAQLDGIYYKPRVDKALLRKYSKGIIALSACLGGEVPRRLLEDKFEQACSTAKEYEEIFGRGNFFLEVQDHGIEGERKVINGLRKVHEQTGIPLVATNDTHYNYKSEAYIQDILLCISMGKTLNDSSRMKFQSEELYLKSEAEMVLLFGEHPEVLKNTGIIADRCNVEFTFGETFLPVFEIPEGFTTDSYLRELAEEAFPRFYPNKTEVELKRLNYELEIITRTGFAGYFLICSDFCRWSKDNGVIVGPGRGSAAASMIAYLLEITSVEPLRFNLLFERFLNPERISMPDIDIDFDPIGRLRVIEYVTQKYGADKVCQICTFGTLAAKAAIKDVGRVLGIPLWKITKITKAIPNDLGITLQKALEISPQFKELTEEDDETRNLIKIAIALEGTHRHASTHAAGVVIAREPLTNYLPLQRTSDEGVMTQFPMKVVEELGLLKMDFLGLRNLTILQGAVDHIEENHGTKLDLRYIPFDDSKTFELLATGNTTGIFQLESSGMRSVIKNLKPTVFEDIIALVALYRPGPMDQIPEFIRRKHGGEIIFLHPKLETVLEPTYGIIVYQEQVMQIAQDLAGYSLGRADLLRRAMGKKKKEIMDEERINFIDGLQGEDGEWIIPGAVRLGANRTVAESIFDLMAKFAEYGFNKGHATAYAMISYQTAYLKANYPKEFAASLLSTVMSSADKISYYINDARTSGIKVLPPDVQYSDIGFTIEENSIRFGMAAIRNVGEGVIERIIKERTESGLFKSLYDFTIRVEGITKRVLESLIKSGAFASLCKRSSGMVAMDQVMQVAAIRQKDKSSGQISLFDIMGGDQPIYDDIEITMPDVDEFPVSELLEFEKEYLGLYLTGHPLTEVMPKLEQLVTTDIFTLMESEEDVNRVKLGGIILNYKTMTTKKGESMALFTLEDMTGQVDVLVFPRLFAQIGLSSNDQIILLEGKLNVQDEEKKIFAEQITPIDKIVLPSKPHDVKPTKTPPCRLYLRVKLGELEEKQNQAHSILKDYPGIYPFCFVLAETREKIVGHPSYWTSGHPDLIKRLEVLLGKQNVVWKSA
ncbi:MAG TPA: DNA polymerase III subunit alpha [Desulfosporosinus sp.]|nr:DNA polymerase III subunit alpha [Desulfosporosinus sp.]